MTNIIVFRIAYLGRWQQIHYYYNTSFGFQKIIVKFSALSFNLSEIYEL